MRIESITAKDPGQNASMIRDYTYSPAGNITAKSTEHGVYTYQYDQLQRLVEAINPQGADEAYTYDALGNRLAAAGITGTWSYNANNELLEYGDVTYQYDDNGNTVKKTVGLQTFSYIYDVEDRLVRVEQDTGGVIASYYYDPFGRRLWKEVDGDRTYFLYSDEGLIGEYDDSGRQIRSYGYAPDSDWTTDPLFYKSEGTYYWYQNDHQGTPQKIIDTSGRVVWSAIYDSFGNIHIETAEVENNLRFAGQYYDAETGLYYNLNRYYDPITGRYFRTDPYGDGLNLYAYVLNNPINFVDPLGLCKVKEIGSGVREAIVKGTVAGWYSIKMVSILIARLGINILSEGLELLHAGLNSRLGVGIVSSIDLLVNVGEIRAGLGLMAGVSFAEIGTAGIATPVSIPLFLVGASSVALGSVGLWEASNRITGAVLNDKKLMKYDYFDENFGDIGKTFIQAKAAADIFRRPAASLKEVLPYSINILRNADSLLARSQNNGN